VSRPDDLDRLIRLRGLRLDRAARALAEQSAAIASAEERLKAATAAAAANADRRSAREGELFERLTMRPLTPHEIGRAHDALDGLERQSHALDAAEQDAVRALEAERSRRQELAVESLKLERERDKLRAVSAARAGAARRRAELAAELDMEGEARPRAGFLARERRLDRA
jgi:hypothetical protein